MRRLACSVLVAFLAAGLGSGGLSVPAGAQDRAELRLPTSDSAVDPLFGGLVAASGDMIVVRALGETSQAPPGPRDVPVVCPSPGTVVPFTDLDAASASHRDDIKCVYELGVTTGTSLTSYSPLENVTRQQMASFLARLYLAITGTEAPAVPVPFNDIDTASFTHRDDIARIYGLGITTGTTPTTFSPLGNVTRQQMASFLTRLYTLATGEAVPVVASPFDDIAAASVSHRDDIAGIYGLEITNGTSPTTYSPLGNVTRQQMASFMARLYRAASSQWAIDFQELIVGSWNGDVTVPAGWSPITDFWVEFRPDGSYSAGSSSSPGGPAFYYGSDDDHPDKVYSVLGKYPNDQPGRGWITIVWDVGTTQRGSLENVRFSEAGDRLQFEFWRTWSGRYGPVVYDLARL